MADSRVESALENILGADNVLPNPMSRIEEQLHLILGEDVPLTGGNSRIEKLLNQIIEQGGASGENKNFGRVVSRTSGSIVCNDTTEVGEYAFYRWPSSKPYTFSSTTVTRINTNAFYDSDGLTKINCPNVTYLGNNAFYQCGNSAFTEVRFPKLTSIAGSAFYYTLNLKVADLGLVTSISQSSLFSETKLTTLILRNPSQVVYENGSAGIASTPLGKGTDGHLIVPRALIDSYTAHTFWGGIISKGTNQIEALEDSAYL